MAQAAEVVEVTVSEQDGRCILHSESLIRVPVAQVRKALTDYPNLPRINPSLKRVEVMERLPGGGTRMGVVSQFCVLAICLDLAWIQEVREGPGGDIVVNLVPNRGDFRAGSGRWRLLPEQGGTRLVFDIELTPNFWVPPAFGPWLMEGRLAEETLATAQALERMWAAGGTERSSAAGGAKRRAAGPGWAGHRDWVRAALWGGRPAIGGALAL